MTQDGLRDAEIAQILTQTRRVAVVGASDRPDRPSYGVMAALLAHGYEVTPVNPVLAGQQLQGRSVVAALDQAGTLDMVDIFRASAAAGAVVDEAVRLGARTVWMQLGVIDASAAARARALGLRVVVDRCPKIELLRLGLSAGK